MLPERNRQKYGDEDKRMNITEMPPSDRSPDTPAGAPRRVFRQRRLFLAIVLTVLISIPLVRNMAPDIDFAVANVVTLILAIIGWLASVAALKTYPHSRRWARVVFWVPIAAGVGFAALFRFERVDGELRPIFLPRWQKTPPLPDESAAPAQVPDEALFAPTSFDFPQFLGPHRNGVIEAVAINPDWQAHPPEILWKQPIGDGWSAYATQGEVAVTMEQRGEEEWVSAYRIGDGTLLWSYAIAAKHFNIMGGTGPRSTPTIDAGRVFACSAVGELVCLDLRSGQRLWSQDLLRLAECTQEEFEQHVAWGRAASPLVFADRVVIPLGGAGPALATLIAFDARTGEPLWRGGDDQISYSSPTLATIEGQPQILLISESKLGAYAPDSGELLWSTPWPGKSNASASCSQPIFVGPNRILLSKGYGTGAKLIEVHREGEQWMVNEIWAESSVLKTKFTSAVVRDGFAYGLSDGILECVDLSTGRRMWKRGRYRQGQLLLVRDKLLISAEDGSLALVPADPQGYVELGRVPVIDGVTWNTLSLSKNRLLMRNSDEAACVLLPVVDEQSGDAEKDPEGEPGRSTVMKEGV
ncbi:MAG: oxidoreductase [Pirellulaceae bacterium]|nr:MAG: oxidoreductase [Pirellulaceae bacterium]